MFLCVCVFISPWTFLHIDVNSHYKKQKKKIKELILAHSSDLSFIKKKKKEKKRVFLAYNCECWPHSHSVWYLPCNIENHDYFPASLEVYCLWYCVVYTSKQKRCVLALIWYKVLFFVMLVILTHIIDKHCPQSYILMTPWSHSNIFIKEM